MNPFVRRIFEQRKTALLSGETPQVVQPVARRRGHGVITIRQQHDIAVADRMHGAFPAARIQHLLAESLRRVDAIVVDLLERRLAVTAIVLVRRKAAPVAWRIEGLANHQAARVRIVDEDIVHFARVDAAAAGVDPHLIGPDEDCLAAARCGRGEGDCFERGFGGYRQLAAGG